MKYEILSKSELDNIKERIKKYKLHQENKEMYNKSMDTANRFQEEKHKRNFPF